MTLKGFFMSSLVQFLREVFLMNKYTLHFLFSFSQYIHVNGGGLMQGLGWLVAMRNQSAIPFFSPLMMTVVSVRACSTFFGSPSVTLVAPLKTPPPSHAPGPGTP
jgi:hypothetical protein